MKRPTIKNILNLPNFFGTAASAVEADSGKAAIMRGPVVYCAEAVDNVGNLGDLFISAHGTFACEYDELSQLYSLVADGERKETQTKLYSKFNGRTAHCKIRLQTGVTVR